MRYLDRHNVVCPDYFALTIIELGTNAHWQMKYYYQCCRVFQNTVVSHVTARVTGQTYHPPENQGNNANTMLYLDRQYVKCDPYHQLMRRFQMLTTAGSIWYHVECLTPAAGYSLTVWQTATLPFDTPTKGVHELGGQRIHCNNNGQTTGRDMGFLVEWTLEHVDQGRSRFVFWCASIN